MGNNPVQVWKEGLRLHMQKQSAELRKLVLVQRSGKYRVMGYNNGTQFAATRLGPRLRSAAGARRYAIKDDEVTT